MQWRATASRRAPRHPYLECPIENLQRILGCVRLSAGYSKLIVTLEKNSAVLVLQALVNCRHALCPKQMTFEGNFSAVAAGQLQQAISQHQRKDLDLKFENVEIDNALFSNGLLQLNGLRSIFIIFPSSNSSIGENGLLAMLQHNRLRTITLNGLKDISVEHIEKFYKEWRKLAKKKKDSGRSAGVNLKLNIIGCTHLRHRAQVDELAHLLDRNSKIPFWHFQSNGSKLAIQIRGADHPDE